MIVDDVRLIAIVGALQHGVLPLGRAVVITARAVAPGVADVQVLERRDLRGKSA